MRSKAAKPPYARQAAAARCIALQSRKPPMMPRRYAASRRYAPSRTL